MDNYTFNSLTLQLEGVNVSKDTLYPVFLFFFFAYIFIMLLNIGIAILIFIDKNLHQPMYLLFCNLPFNDILGNSIMVPRLLIDMMKPSSQRFISYYECVAQAFSTHMFGTTMALVLVGILLGLTIRLNRCRTLIMNPFCDNASLFKLSCESVFINNVYGLTFTVVLFTCSIGSMVITYTKITVVCLTSNSKSLNSKALKTCSTHLVVFLIMLISGFIVIILHRFPQYSDYRKLSAILFHIIPGSLNPIIYGVQSAEICKSLSKLFRSKPVILNFLC
uniref:G-protein coupled receptors family 1 profile domain-containing protein n=1 Tax=Cyclopterus lumpus TaxID=8103 RepID=A0A8C2XKA0_CYCLU